MEKNMDKDLIVQKLNNLDQLVFQMRMDITSLQSELLPSVTVTAKIENGLAHQNEMKFVTGRDLGDEHGA